MERREFVKAVGAAAVGSGLRARVAAAEPRPAGEALASAYDVAVVGAGVFGAWTAWHLARRGEKVVVVEAHGPGHARSSSGGETRVIRMAYGPDEIYTRWSWRALSEWKALAERTGQPLFHETGVLFLSRDGDAHGLASLETLARVGVPHEKLEREALARRFPHIDLGPVTWGLWEPQSGVLLARRAVAAVLAEAVAAGATWVRAAAEPAPGTGDVEALGTRGGESVRARRYVFACGPWLPKLFPAELEGRIVPTRQEVLFFGTPPGDGRFSAPAHPAWIDFGEEIYGVPDIEARGFKVAIDRHGPVFDPDASDRTVTAATLGAVRGFLARRFPALGDAPLVESRVCQYENSSNGDFLVDRHPQRGNVWLVGGGSGHGFKHGPALGEHVAACLLGEAQPEPRFRLAAKQRSQRRSVH